MKMHNIGTFQHGDWESYRVVCEIGIAIVTVVASHAVQGPEAPSMISNLSEVLCSASRTLPIYLYHNTRLRI